MRKWLRSLGVIGIVTTLVTLIIVGYKVQWTGFSAKTLWDWLGVLAIPAAVGGGTLWFTVKQAQVNNTGNTDNQREAALQEYIDKMSELLLVNNLRKSEENEEVRNIARVRTLAVLRQLDPPRKTNVLQFLVEAGLVEKGRSVVNLRGARLDFADLDYVPLFQIDLNFAILNCARLNRTDLSGASLCGTYLVRSNLQEADLSNAILKKASLDYANLKHAKLSRVCLSEASLRGAKLRRVNLCGADLSGATLDWADLQGSDLKRANLARASLRGVTLRGADLNGADLSGADLNWIKLERTDLRGANLNGAKNITDEQLCSVLSLKGTIMPDGSIHP